MSVTPAEVVANHVRPGRFRVRVNRLRAAAASPSRTAPHVRTPWSNTTTRSGSGAACGSSRLKYSSSFPANRRTNSSGSRANCDGKSRAGSPRVVTSAYPPCGTASAAGRRGGTDRAASSAGTSDAAPTSRGRALAAVSTSTVRTGSSSTGLASSSPGSDGPVPYRSQWSRSSSDRAYSRPAMAASNASPVRDFPPPDPGGPSPLSR